MRQLPGQLRARSALCAEADQRQVLAEIADEARLIHPVLARADDGDALVGVFKTVADRAEPHQRPRFQVLKAGQGGFDVPRAGGNQHAARLDLHLPQPQYEASIVAAAQLIHSALADLTTAAAQLLAQAAQQVIAADAVGKARVIVGARNQRCPAASGVVDADVPVEAAKVDGCGETGRAGAHDDAVQWHRLLLVRSGRQAAGSSSVPASLPQCLSPLRVEKPRTCAQAGLSGAA